MSESSSPSEKPKELVVSGLLNELVLLNEEKSYVMLMMNTMKGVEKKQVAISSGQGMYSFRNSDSANSCVLNLLRGSL